MNSNLTKSQTRTFTKKLDNYRTITATVRYDDECGNGHNSFAITGEIAVRGRTDICGCIHEEIEKYFPELRHLIKWHLVSADEPMHYVANSMYHAGFGEYSKRNVEYLKSTMMYGAIDEYLLPEDELINADASTLRCYLNLRLSRLMQAFKSDVEAFGFVY